MSSFKYFPFGILPDGKRIPLISDWQNKASNDPNQIKLWQDQYRDRIKGWALPTGAINGIYALDIDVKDGRNGFDYLKNQGIVLPNTAWQVTPSGGVHLFFKHNPHLGLKNTVDREAGVDGRSDNGFVWVYNLQNLENLSDIPDWLPNLVRKPVNHIDPTQTNSYLIDPKIGHQRLVEALNALANAQPGERNHTLNKVSFTIGQLISSKAVDPEHAKGELNRIALSIGLDPSEIHATANSGLKGGFSHPLSHPFGDKPPIPAIPIIAPLPVVTEVERWTPRYPTKEELMNWSKLKKPQLFKDWSPEDIMLTSAIGGVGKTTLKLFEAVCLALGEPFLGFECLTPGRTLFVIGEDSEAKVKAMLGRICDQLGLFEPGQEHKLQRVMSNVLIKLADDLTLVHYNKALNLYVTNQESLTKLQQGIDDLNPKQIIFDPIAMFSGPEAGGNDMAVALAKTMQVIQRRSGASIDMIAHIGKDSATKKDTGQFSARGATALANHSRVIRTLLKLNPDEFTELTGETLGDGQTAIQCFVSKFSDGSPLLDGSFLIMRDGYCFSKKLIPTNNGISNNTQQDKTRVMNYIKGNSTVDKPLTEKNVCDHFYIQSPKIGKTAVKAMVSELEREGVIFKEDHPDSITGFWLRPL